MVAFRFIEALSLALQVVFNETTVFTDRLLPGELAILAAAFQANGASASLASLDANLLTRAERALVAPVLQGSP